MLNKMSGKKIAVAVGIVALVAAVAAFAVVAVNANQSQADAERGMGDGGMHHGGMGGDNIIGLLAEESGLSVEDIRAELEAGQTIAQVAAANGVDIDALIESALADKQAMLDQAVADGRLTQEEADAKLAEIADSLQQHVNEVIDFSQQPQGPGGPGGRGPGGGQPPAGGPGQPGDGQGA